MDKGTTTQNQPFTWRKKKVLVIGAARQGCAVSRYLYEHGAEVILNDIRTEEHLSKEINSLKGYEIKLVMGSHPISLLEGVDCVCVSGGVPLSNPLIQTAKKMDIWLTNDSQIFFDASPAEIIGISGSAGKTTTTTMLGRIATAAQKMSDNKFNVWVGGNIGNPLITYVDEIKPGDVVICELSSFQLELMNKSPHIAALLNITPNHLDRHGTMEAYISAKTNIIRFQTSTDVAVLSREDEISKGLATTVKGVLQTFGRNKLQKSQHGTYLEDNKIMLQNEQGTFELCKKNDIALRGEHNLLNVLAACAIAGAAHLPLNACKEGIVGFRGVAHRLEVVRELAGITFINDSIATAPERSLAALRSFDEPILLLLGGRDKKLPWDELAKYVNQRVDHVFVFGEAAEMIAETIRLYLNHEDANQRLKAVHHCKSIKQAVQEAASLARKGDIVLFSPGGTSFDEFKDFEERGERYRAWVNELVL